MNSDERSFLHDLYHILICHLVLVAHTLRAVLDTGTLCACKEGEEVTHGCHHRLGLFKLRCHGYYNSMQCPKYVLLQLLEVPQ